MSDSELLIYFLDNDYTQYLGEKSEDDFLIQIRINFLKALRGFALNGDVKRFKQYMSQQTLDYFPELESFFL